MTGTNPTHANPKRNKTISGTDISVRATLPKKNPVPQRHPAVASASTGIIRLRVVNIWSDCKIEAEVDLEWRTHLVRYRQWPRTKKARFDRGKLHMLQRRLRVVKWLSTTPALAVCTLCSREFKVPTSALRRTADAQASLQEQFGRHKCRPLDSSHIGAQAPADVLHRQEPDADEEEDEEEDDRKEEDDEDDDGSSE